MRILSIRQRNMAVYSSYTYPTYCSCEDLSWKNTDHPPACISYYRVGLPLYYNGYLSLVAYASLKKAFFYNQFACKAQLFHVHNDLCVQVRPREVRTSRCRNISANRLDLSVDFFYYRFVLEKMSVQLVGSLVKVFTL